MPHTWQLAVGACCSVGGKKSHGHKRCGVSLVAVVSGFPLLHWLAWVGALRWFGRVGVVCRKYRLGRLFIRNWIVSFGWVSDVRCIYLVGDVVAIEEVDSLDRRLAAHQLELVRDGG